MIFGESSIEDLNEDQKYDRFRQFVKHIHDLIANDCHMETGLNVSALNGPGIPGYPYGNESGLMALKLLAATRTRPVTVRIQLRRASCGVLVTIEPG